MTSVSQMDLESDSLFPHIPMSSNWEERKPRTQEADGSIRGDLPNIMLLMFLYILQGIPLGLAGSIPMLLQSRKVRMCQKFSFFTKLCTHTESVMRELTRTTHITSSKVSVKNHYIAYITYKCPAETVFFPVL